MSRPTLRSLEASAPFYKARNVLKSWTGPHQNGSQEVEEFEQVIDQVDYSVRACVRKQSRPRVVG